MIMEFTHGNVTIKINSLNKGLIEINFDLSKINKVFEERKNPFSGLLD